MMTSWLPNFPLKKLFLAATQEDANTSKRSKSSAHTPHFQNDIVVSPREQGVTSKAPAAMALKIPVNLPAAEEAKNIDQFLTSASESEEAKQEKISELSKKPDVALALIEGKKTLIEHSGQRLADTEQHDPQAYYSGPRNLDRELSGFPV